MYTMKFKLRIIHQYKRFQHYHVAQTPIFVRFETSYNAVVAVPESGHSSKEKIKKYFTQKAFWKIFAIPNRSITKFNPRLACTVEI